MGTLYLLIAAIVGPLLVGGLTYGYEELWDKPQAVKAAVEQAVETQTLVCAGKLADMAGRAANDALAASDAASAAVASLRPLPADKAARKAACDADPLCRQRGQP